MRWVTRERPKVDRIACPWLVSRFIDRDAEFLYVPTAEVQQTAAQAMGRHLDRVRPAGVLAGARRRGGRRRGRLR